MQAYYLPRGNGSNAGEQPLTFTVPARQVRIYDDIVTTLLHRGDVGGIRFVSNDDFVGVVERVTGRFSGPEEGARRAASAPPGLVIRIEPGVARGWAIDD